jgi:nitrate reductase NapE component
VDPTSLIFVALAIAWAVYLIPKAVQHHDEVVRSRSVDRFSQTMRVLARREPVNRRNARLVVTPGRGAQAPIVTTKAATLPAPPLVEGAPTSRAATQVATKRRRRVLGLILVSLVAVGAVAGFGVISWSYVAIPAGLLVAWLVACRVMVKSERRVRVTAAAPVRVSTAPATQVPASATCPDLDGGYTADDDTSMTPAVIDPALWDPVPVTLPTYVSKPAAARRTVRTIDLDATGVWTSGRTEADAVLAREADAAARAERKVNEAAAADRATGS